MAQLVEIDLDKLDDLISERVALHLQALRRPDLEKIERLEREIAQLRLAIERRDEHLRTFVEGLHAEIHRVCTQATPHIVAYVRDAREQSRRAARREFAKEMAALDKFDDDGVRRRE